jgi:hypothetical protein
MMLFVSSFLDHTSGAVPPQCRPAHSITDPTWVRRLMFLLFARPSCLQFEISVIRNRLIGKYYLASPDMEVSRTKMAINS